MGKRRGRRASSPDLDQSGTMAPADKKAVVAELASAHRSRGQCARRSQEEIGKVQQRIQVAHDAAADGSFSEQHLHDITGRLELAKDKVAAFREAVELCERLEGMTLEEANQCEYTDLLYDAESRLDDCIAEDRSFRAGFQARQAEARAANAVRVQVAGGVQAAAGPATAKVRAQRPPTLDVDITYAKFVKWKQAWENFVKIEQITTLACDVQVAHLRQCCTPDLQDKMHHAMDIREGSTDTLDQTITKFEDYLKRQHNVAHDRLRMVQLKQGDGESFDDYYTRLCVCADEAELRTDGVQ